MRRTFLIAGLCIASLAAASQPGIARDRSPDDRSPDVRGHAASDWSAARKKKHRQYVYVRHAPQAGYVRHPWMDPSFGPDGRPYPNPYPPNVCSIDLGYGRFSSCDFRD